MGWNRVPREGFLNLDPRTYLDHNHPSPGYIPAIRSGSTNVAPPRTLQHSPWGGSHAIVAVLVVALAA